MIATKESNPHIVILFYPFIAIALLGAWAVGLLYFREVWIEARLLSRYMAQRPVTMKRLYCRVKGHGDMVWFSHGLEPDTRCVNCGDDLG